MKLHSLYIKEYKILKDFRIDFDNPISVLIGMNGSGKSTVLEALALIFNSRAAISNNDFEFEITYSTIAWNREQVKVKMIKEKGDEQRQIQIIEVGESAKINLEKVFASNIVIYYSGFSDIMQKIVEPFNKILQNSYRKGDYQAKSQFFYFTPAHFNIILATLFSYEYGDIPKFLEEKIGTKKINSLTIRLKKPSWAATKKMEEWWGAEGEIKRFLDYLDSISSSLPIENNNTNKINGSVVIEGVFNEYIVITIIGQGILYEIRDYFGEEKGFFNILNVMLLDGLLDYVEINMLQKEGLKTFKSLSEGEQQAIVVKGLTELLTEENTLFLFDEPDVYLHPKWQGEFIKNISESNTENTQYVITTHSTVMLSNLKDGALYRMKDGKAQYIENGYYGKGYENNLENYFEVGSRNEEAAEELANLFQLIDEEKYSEATQVIDNLQVKYPNEPELTRAQTLIALLQEDDEI